MAYNPVGLQHINIVDKTVTAKAKLGVSMADLAGALQKKQNDIFGPLLGITAKITTSPAIDTTACNLIIIDKAADADFLGVHTMIVGGFPSAKVLAEECLKEGGSDNLTITVSHEVDELLGDPYANAWVDGPHEDVVYAFELCDACEELSFKVGKIAVSDFLLRPFFYAGTRDGTKLDYMGKVKKPFETLHGGYQTTCKLGQYNNIFGSREKAERFALEDRSLHRSQYRTGFLNLPALISGSPEEEAVFQRASRE